MSDSKRQQLIDDGMLDPETGRRRNYVAEQETQDYEARLNAAKASGDEQAIRDVLGHQSPEEYEKHGVAVSDAEREAYALEAGNPDLLLQFRQDGQWDAPVPRAGSNTPPPIEIT